MIRTLLVVLFLFIFLILSIPLFGFYYIYEKINYEKAHKQQYKIVQWAFKVVLFFSGTKLTINGFDNIPENEATLFIGNHQSYFDVVVAYAICPNITGFIAKQGIKKIPLFATWMRRNFCLFLDRDNPRQGITIIKTAIEYIKSGVSMFVFPEGTRSKNGQMADFKEGSFKIATKTGCKIIPVAITGTRDIFESHIPFIRKQAVTITFGTPIIIENLPEEDKKHIGNYTKNIISNMLESNN